MLGFVFGPSAVLRSLLRELTQKHMGENLNRTVWSSTVKSLEALNRSFNHSSLLVRDNLEQECWLFQTGVPHYWDLYSQPQPLAHIVEEKKNRKWGKITENETKQENDNNHDVIR